MREAFLARQHSVSSGTFDDTPQLPNYEEITSSHCRSHLIASTRNPTPQLLFPFLNVRGKKPGGPSLATRIKNHMRLRVDEGTLCRCCVIVNRSFKQRLRAH